MVLNPALAEIGSLAQNMSSYLCFLGFPDSFIDFFMPLFSFIHIFFQTSVGLVCVELFLERLYATVRPEDYENIDSHRFGTLCIISTLIYGVFFTVSGIYNYYVNPYHMFILPDQALLLYALPVVVCFCWFSFAFVTIPAIIGVIIMVRYNSNKLKKRGHGTLTTRYQYQENVNGLKVVLNMFLTIIVCASVGVGSAMLLFWDIMTHRVYMPKLHGLMRICQFDLTIASVATTTIALLSHPALRQIVKQDLTVFSKRKQAAKVKPYHMELKKDVEMETQVYFNQLQESWI
ncbi:unnamed protein product [Bursaphelenchus okinawaensis]|uniref:G_PROTEIN_RECEP_F1_2 domain-containing protein n=1 Tax=Bursaphelenchus okinawaensis TaxID=465554 RepID=A0A811LNY3_9BILA|nr:unnamed protein product [Bursaphelenchus okinawaensis]CAG9124697.1 unnamed protein product [Bursaphelenchus okinawaensis]